MKSNHKNQILLLLGLVALWGAVLLWQLGHSGEAERVPLKNVSGVKAVGKKPTPASAGGTLHVNLERLDQITGQRSATFSAPRNIFASLTPPPPVAAAAAVPRRPRGPRGPQPAPPPSVPIEEEEEETPQAEESQAVSQEKLERLRVTAELTQFRYLGFLKVGDNRQGQNATAVLVKNEEMHLVQSGETIAKEVLVKAISPSEITLQDVATKITQVIPVTEEAAAPTPSN
ncbi:MAG TPA: hypothetical protein VFQ34_13565 [Nitrospiraceae bacterium]|nr:hypothetical protein [Nitrospiraceae bacterium]